MTFLDWEKAFDNIHQGKLLQALTRLGIPDKVLKVLNTFYASPTFTLKDPEGRSSERRQATGIRQGCPLSPYLFIPVMTCIDIDTKTEHSNRIRNNIILGIFFPTWFIMQVTHYCSPHIQEFYTNF